jgi:endonuclease III
VPGGRDPCKNIRDPCENIRKAYNNIMKARDPLDFRRKAVELSRRWHDIWKRISERPSLNPSQQRFLKQHEFAPLIATICDERIPAEVAWGFPEWLYNRLGSFELQDLIKKVNYKAELEQYLKEHQERLKELNEDTKLNEDTIKDYLESVPKKINDALEYFEKRGMTPVTMFENRKYPAPEVYFMLRVIPGIGPKKASMITRDFVYRSLGLVESNAWFDQIKERNPEFDVIRRRLVSIPIDVRVVMVFGRLFGLRLRRAKWRCLQDSSVFVQDVIAFSKLAFPDLPAKLDDILWNVGRDWCDNGNPRCQECLLRDICDTGQRFLQGRQ